MRGILNLELDAKSKMASRAALYFQAAKRPAPPLSVGTLCHLRGSQFDAIHDMEIPGMLNPVCQY